MVRCAVAASLGDEPPGGLARLAEDPDSSVRSFLAMNDRLPPELLVRLAADPERSVRSWIVQRGRDVPDAVRRMLLTDTGPGIRSDSARVFPPPADLLPGLLADPATRAGAVAHTVSTPELAADPDSDVRRAALPHIRTCPPVRATCWQKTRTCSCATRKRLGRTPRQSRR